jgi:hypothetical protein
VIDLIASTYERAPALVLGLAVLLALPPLVVVGLAFRRRAAIPDRADATQLYRRGAAPKAAAAVVERAEEPLWPSHAWIEIPGAGRRPVGHIVRLGRDVDNDICLDDKTVHRYHAAIHRTDDAAYVITDLSRSGGNGVLVNGRRTLEGLLQDGDTIELGQTKLRFLSSPA